MYSNAAKPQRAISGEIPFTPFYVSNNVNREFYEIFSTITATNLTLAKLFLT